MLGETGRVAVRRACEPQSPVGFLLAAAFMSRLKTSKRLQPCRGNALIAVIIKYPLQGVSREAGRACAKARTMAGEGGMTETDGLCEVEEAITMAAV